MAFKTWLFNKRYSISCVMLALTSRICFLSRNAMIYRSKDYLMFLSVCLLALAVRHKSLLDSKKTKKKNKWIEIF